MIARLLLCLTLLWGGVAQAHSMWPASLQLVESDDGTVWARWEVPLRGGRPLPLRVAYPEACVQQGTPVVSGTPTSHRVDRVLRCSAPGLAGRSLTIEGFEKTQSDALVVVEHADGRATTALLHVAEPTLVVPEAGAPPPDASRYFGVGVEHIWTGVDHVLFVVGLVLVCGHRWGSLLRTVTAFTVTHSVTLALSVLGFVRFPQASVEAVIALSILLLAVEVARGDPRSWTLRAPWVVAAVSGLVHGLGFAGALSDIGLPEGAVPSALLRFNLGVEAGQLVVVAVTLAAAAGARRLPLPAGAARLPALALGSVSAFWLFDRISAMVSV